MMQDLKGIGLDLGQGHEKEEVQIEQMQEEQSVIGQILILWIVW